ncbi:MAG: cation-efflux pump [candidate division WOR-3 bacterium]|nr:cation-efflux pump [candidate division WOR-3 bacterium]MCX7836841.1 cation-efflux pump [candidate division WOR-3 bacterium]MDW8114290.1 cation diffusion facilitator family transporter [candidate division WOR-3 bacterium]
MIAQKITVISIFLNIILSFLKIFLGILGKSQAIIADGIHSLSDLITDLGVLFSLSLSQKEKDITHPYGHYRVENLSALILAIVLIGTSFYLGFYSFITFLNILNKKVTKEISSYVLIGSILTILLKEILFRVTKKIGERLNNSLLVANAYHHRSDVFSSIATTIGVSLAIFFGKEYLILDPIISFILIVIIVITGIKIFIKEGKILIDTQIEEKEREKIEKIIKESEGGKYAHDIRTRRSGGKIFIDFHLSLDKEHNLFSAHQLTENLEKEIKGKIENVEEVFIHLEPKEEPIEKEELEKVIYQNLKNLKEIKEIKKIKIFPFYEAYQIDLEIRIRKNYSLTKIHEIIHKIEEELMKLDFIKKVNIHIEP